MRLISKKKLNLAKHVGDQANLQCLHIQGNDAYVSNGHTLFHIHEEEPSTDDFPEVGNDAGDISTDNYLIRSETASKALKNFPKDKNLSILNYALLTEKEKLSLTTTDLENTVTVQQRKKDVTPPEWESVIPKEVIAETHIDFKRLQQLVSAIADYRKEADFAGGTVRVKMSFMKHPFANPGDPLTLVCSIEGGDNSTLKAVIMPLRGPE